MSRHDSLEEWKSHDEQLEKYDRRFLRRHTSGMLMSIFFAADGLLFGVVSSSLITDVVVFIFVDDSPFFLYSYVRLLFNLTDISDSLTFSMFVFV